MEKRFLRKVIGRNDYPRCHYTRKKHRWKPKVPYVSLQAAKLFIEERKLENSEAYRCPICGQWHIGFHQEKEQKQALRNEGFYYIEKCLK